MTKPGTAVSPAQLDPKRLHEATDRLNSALADFENALRELNLGVSASVSLDEADPGTLLSFEKISGEFALGVESLNGEWSFTPVANTSRETRLKASHRLSVLCDEMMKQFDAEVSRVEKAITKASALADALRTTRKRELGHG